jgi:L-ascorbate metabolism protein UlaG (beta-lactamase superfamily)
MVQPIEDRRTRAAQEYPALYKKVIDQWKLDGDDAFWLIYSANYLFRCGGVRWAVDPVILSSRFPSDFSSHLEVDFEKTDFIVLTHRHSDHLDKKLLQAISDINIPWVVPEFMLDEVNKIVHLPDHRIIIPIPGKQLEISGIKIITVEGSHWEKTGDLHSADTSLHGVPAYSYLFEAHNKKWFIPGDTRTYDLKRIPQLGHLDGLIAHVWLGRNGAMKDPPPLLDKFCEYFLRITSSKIVLTHLDEWGRAASDLWTNHHADLITQKMRVSSPVKVISAVTGDQVSI